MLKPIVICLALLFLAAPAVAEEEPTMHQVYLAAQAGKFSEAQSMMDKVLHDHPNSAKAHFVEAELLAKQGLLSKAADELNTAERLKPGLPFAKPEAVKSLKSRISSAPTDVAQPNAVAGQSLSSSINDWMPWVLLILGIGLVVLLIGYMSRRNSNVIPANSYGGNTFNPNMPTVGGNGAGPVMGQPVVGGTGSGLMGSLATGAALGAGVVAGEALMHHFIDGDKHNDNVVPEPPHHDASPWSAPNQIDVSDNNDMGGTDFGIADASSWDDDGTSDSGDDWS
jgi:hypothetical protein